MKRQTVMTDIAFDTAVKALRKGKQAMVFVHSRKDTTKTAQDFRRLAQERGLLSLLFPFGTGLEDDGSNPLTGPAGAHLRKDLEKSRNQDVRDLLRAGLGNGLVRVLFALFVVSVQVVFAGIHNAGMLRHDRNLTERLFAAGAIRVRVCLLACTPSFAPLRVLYRA
jgi:Lhr-like helicase